MVNAVGEQAGALYGELSDATFTGIGGHWAWIGEAEQCGGQQAGAEMQAEASQGAHWRHAGESGLEGGSDKIAGDRRNQGRVELHDYNKRTARRCSLLLLVAAMLYSTKRKLHNLLNGPQHAKLPGATTATNSSTAVPAVTETKKRRLADGDAGTMSPGQPSIRAVSPSASVRSALSTGSVLRSPSTRAQPAYAPWDRNAFLARLSTYRFVDKWTAKPAAVNEVAWSKRGWVCIDKNRVMCTVCHRELLVKVEGEDDATDEGRALVERYEVMAVEAHEDSCLWARRGCDGVLRISCYG